MLAEGGCGVGRESARSACLSPGSEDQVSVDRSTTGVAAAASVRVGLHSEAGAMHRCDRFRGPGEFDVGGAVPSEHVEEQLAGCTAQSSVPRTGRTGWCALGRRTACPPLRANCSEGGGDRSFRRTRHRSGICVAVQRGVVPVGIPEVPHRAGVWRRGEGVRVPSSEADSTSGVAIVGALVLWRPCSAGSSGQSRREGWRRISSAPITQAVFRRPVRPHAACELASMTPRLLGGSADA